MLQKNYPYLRQAILSHSRDLTHEARSAELAKRRGYADLLGRFTSLSLLASHALILLVVKHTAAQQSVSPLVLRSPMGPRPSLVSTPALVQWPILSATAGVAPARADRHCSRTHISSATFSSSASRYSLVPQVKASHAVRSSPCYHPGPSVVLYSASLLMSTLAVPLHRRRVPL